MPARKSSKNCPDCGAQLIRTESGYFKKRCLDCQRIFDTRQKDIYLETRKVKRRVPTTNRNCQICGEIFEVTSHGKTRKICNGCNEEVLDPKGRTFTPLPVRMRKRKYFLMKHYGLSLDARTRILVTQNGKCAICGIVETEENFLHVDHDHQCCPSNTSCGRCIRGLLCSKCNRALGMINDDLEIAQLLSEYVLRHSRVVS